MQQNENKQVTPVKVGDVVDVLCCNAAKQENTAVAKVNGFVLFVKNATVGQRIKARVDKVFPKYGYASVVEHG